MTEDAKPGFALSEDIGDALENARVQGAEVEVAVAGLLKDHGVERLARLDRDEPVFDDGDFGGFDLDGIDDGSLF